MIAYYRTDQATGVIRERTRLLAGTWIRAERPNEDEVATLRALGIDADILTDALDPHEVPRIEHDDGWTYFITRVPDVGDDFNDYTTPIMFALGTEQTITISRDLLGRLWQPFIDTTRASTGQQTHLFLVMVEMILQSYQTRVALINRQMRAATSDIVNLSPKDIATFVEYERKLNDYLDALIPTNVALEKTLSPRTKLINLKEEDSEIVEDLSVDIEQVIARCKSLLRTITNVRDSYRAVMDTRLNETMRILTVATLALTIPTMLAGLFGMNVEFPFDPNASVTFWAIILISVLAAASISYYFIKKR
ncbi:magnesium transporter CorA family protein [Candidatus Saccharibacteria bacterium]|nr:magnesium transporter CorA family protein [Candidatus Saccharibacteria bacterium]